MNPKVIQARALFVEGLLRLVRQQADIIINVLQTTSIPAVGQKVLYLEVVRYKNVLVAAVEDLDIDPAADVPLLGMPQAIGLRERIDSAIQSIGAINILVNRLDVGGSDEVDDTSAQKTALRARLVSLRDAIRDEVGAEL